MPRQTGEQSPRAQVLEPVPVRIPDSWLTMGRFLNVSVPQFPHLQYGGKSYHLCHRSLTRTKGDNTHKALWAILGIYACWLIKFSPSAPSEQARYLGTHLDQDTGSELSALQSAKVWKVFPVSCSIRRNQKPSSLVRFSNWPQTKISILMWGWKHRAGELNEADWERSRVGSVKFEKCFPL